MSHTQSAAGGTPENEGRNVPDEQREPDRNGTPPSGTDPGERDRDAPPEEDRERDGAEPGEGEKHETQEDSEDERRGFGQTMQDIFLPILPALIGAGILQGITSILVVFGIVAEGTSIHTVLTTISAAIFYFLPFLLAVSTARVFGTSPALAIGVVAFFLYPEIVDLMAGGRDLTLLGIPVVNTTYTSSVIPIILMIWGMSYIHRWTARLIPDVLQTVLVPPLVIAVTTIVGLLVLGPIGAALTGAVNWVISTLQDNAAWVVPLLVGALGSLLISVGLSFALFPIALESINAQGYDSVYGPGMLASNMALAGMALAVAIKVKNKDYSAFSYSASGTALLGVAQPALYGVAIALRKPFIGVISGGAVGGLIAGLAGFQVYSLGPAGLTAIPLYISSDGWANLILAFVVMVAGFGVSFAVTWFVGFDQPSQKTIKQMTD